MNGKIAIDELVSIDYSIAHICVIGLSADSLFKPFKSTVCNRKGFKTADGNCNISISLSAHIVCAREVAIFNRKVVCKLDHLAVITNPRRHMARFVRCIVNYNNVQASQCDVVRMQ